MIYDTIIIGGGPAGCSAAVYVARKQMKALIIAERFGGQSSVSNDVDNWIGDIHLSGFELAQKFEKHVKAQAEIGLEIKEGDLVIEISELLQTEFAYPIFEIRTQKGEVLKSKTLILTPGAHRRKLGIPGEAEFTGKGVAYCATCDAPFYSGKKVGVVGGGNAGLESALDLLPYATEVYLFERSDKLRGDAATAERLLKNPKFKGVLYNTAILEVKGDKFLSTVIFENSVTKQSQQLELQGLFIEIGSIPNSDMVKNLVNLNDFKEIVIDHKYSTTSKPGIFAAGDVSDEAFKQNNISAGDGVKAALSAHAYVEKLKS